MIWKGRKKVALVGRRLSGNENLGLGYLTTALKSAGFDVQIEYINRGIDIERICRVIQDGSFFMIGLSLSDGGSSFLPLALGECIRQKGYRGHITAGGHFATLADEWLLNRYNWLDSVVRFAGEVPIVDLANCLCRGGNISALRGVRTRRGAGLPAPVLDRTPMELWPTRDMQPEILGYGVAQISATRGCKGRCTYCGPAAIQAREKAEAVSLGASQEELRACGVGGVRRRDLDDLCDEMAELWHKNKVRYFYLVDEHLLPYREAEALEYLHSWQRKLEQRRIGKFGMGLMLRAERITEAIIESFRRVGLVRCFVGLELATPAEGKTFQRRIDPERNLSLLQSFNRLGVETVSNLMLVHPYSTIETISSGIQYLERIGTGLFETTRMMPYHGTRLADRLQTEGRLEGNPLRYGYGFDNPQISLFVQLFARLRARSFRDYSLAYYAHDVFVSMALLRQLYPRRHFGSLTERVETLRRQINQTYVSSYKTALFLATQRGGDVVLEDRLVSTTTKRVQGIQAELAEVDSRLNELLRDSINRYSPLAGAAAAVFAFSMIGGSASGCYQSHSDDGTELESDTEPSTELDTQSDTTLETDTTGSTDSDTGSVLECEQQEVDDQKEKIVDNMSEEVPCFDGALRFDGTGEVEATATRSKYPLRFCHTEDLAELEDAAEKAALDTEPSCPIGTVRIEGDLSPALTELYETTEKECNSWVWQVNPHDFVIHLDAEGYVTDVTIEQENPDLQATAACVLKALQGLKFPCLANFDICPEYLIAE